MPIKYTVLNNGHYIHAVAEEKVSSHEFIKYEIDHATDSKIKSPIVELFEIRPFALDDISQQDIQQILEERKKTLENGIETVQSSMVQIANQIQKLEPEIQKLLQKQG